MRVLVTGAGGMLGADLVPVFLERGHQVLAMPRARLDITDAGAVESAVDAFAPELVVNCAAYTRVDDAEKEREQAFAANGLGVQNLCLACQERDTPLLHFSTDYIFDGTKEGPYTVYDRPNPLSAYGASKLLGEQYVFWLLKRFYLVRTGWLYGRHGRNFVETVLELGRTRRSLKVVDDQRGCPTWTCDLSAATADLVETGRFGVYNITGTGTATWFEFAGEILRLAGMEVEVIPVTSAEFPRPARRPANSVLDPFPLNHVLGGEMRDWRSALEEYMGRD